MSKLRKWLFAVPVLAAGVWFFLVAGPEGGSYTAAELPPQPNSEVAVPEPFVAPAQLAPIRGHVTSQSGSYEEQRLVLLTPETPPREVMGAQVAWSGAPDARSGSFEFQRLPPGDYTLELRPTDLAGIEPRTLLAQPSQRQLEFVVQDSGTRAEVRVRVVADEDGSELRAFRLNATVRGGPERASVVLKTGATEAVLRAAPLGATLDLCVEMQGRQMLWTSVLVAHEPEPLELRLKPGWGAGFRVLGPALEPLVGAVVFLDGEIAGVADAQGLVRATLPRVPRACRVEYQEWKLAPGSEVSAETGQFRTRQSSIQVRMEPSR